MDVRYLGPLSVRRRGDEVVLGGPKPRLVLAHLVVHARAVVSTEQLIDAVWGEEPPITARNTLQTYVSHLRRSVGSDRVETHGRGYLLRVDPEEVDAVRFESLLAEGRRVEADDPPAAVRLLDGALALWRGEPFADLAVDGLLAGEVARLQELRWSATEGRIAAQMACERPGPVIAELESLALRHPLRERLWELLMLALYRGGRQSDALAAFDRARAILAEQVGVDPSARVTQLHRRILGHDPSLSQAAFGSGSPAPRRADVTTADVAGAAVPFPTLLAAGTRARYVGRPGLVDQLRRRWHPVTGAAASHTVLLTGEPGIGKTRTATEIARSAHEEGALVLAGRCDEGLSVPYQPWLETLDWQTRHDPALPLGRLGGELTRLLPELTDRIPDLPAPIATDPSLEEHRLYEAVASWLVAVAQRRPVVVVIDDLHWATTPTLRLLVHVVRSLAGEPDTRLLLVATYRDTDIEADHPLHAMLAALRRTGAGLDILPVERLTEPEVSALVADLTATARTDVAGSPSHPEDGRPEGDAAGTTTRGVDPLASFAFSRSRGNPFFATEIVRHCTEVGAASLDGDTWVVDETSASILPDSVRDVVHHRLQRLATPTREVLRLVALLGPDTDVAILTALVEDTDLVVDALEVTWRCGLVEETEEDRYRLTHALIRMVILADLPAARRRRYHARIVDRLELVRPDDVMALAHHSFEAGPGDEERHRALGYAITAGERALAQRAADDAVGWFTRACNLASHLPRIDPGLGLRARCGLGEAQRDAGDQTYRETLLAATQGALAADHLGLAVRAAIANHRAATVSIVGAVDRERVTTLESLLARLPEATDAELAQRARILALLSLELTFDRTQLERRLLLADEAFAIAQALDDPLLEAWVVTTTRVPVTVPERVPELVRRTDRAASLADDGADPFLRCATKVINHQAKLGVGDLRGARQQAQEALELATASGVPYLRILTGFNAVQFHAYDGDLTAARAANAACLAYSQEVGEADTQTWWGAIEALLAVIDGTVANLTEPITDFADAFPEMLAWRAAQAMALALGGHADQARGVLDAHRLRHPEALPRDWLTASAWADLAIAAFELEDRELGGMLMSCVGPYRAQWAHVNVFCQTPLELTWGLAAAAAGHVDQAVRALRRGRELLRGQGLRSHLPWAALYLARTQTRHPDPACRSGAHTVAADGLETACSLGMEVMESTLRALEVPA